MKTHRLFKQLSRDGVQRADVAAMDNGTCSSCTSDQGGRNSDATSAVSVGCHH